MSSAKPQPVRDVWNGPFWDGCRNGQLDLPYCLTTAQFFFPPAPVSPFTGSTDWEWRQASGSGTVWSFVVFHQNYFPGFADDIPYPVLMVKLDEGPFLLTNLQGSDMASIKIGHKVHAVFDGETGLVQFTVEG